MKNSKERHYHLARDPKEYSKPKSVLRYTACGKVLKTDHLVLWLQGFEAKRQTGNICGDCEQVYIKLIENK